MGDCPSPLFPETQNCSGKGIACIEQQCICEEGWIGRGDFVSGSPACHLNIVGVRIIWGFVAVAHSLNFVFACYFFLSRVQMKKTLFPRDVVSLIGGTAIFASACLAALGYIRLVDPTRTIGTDPAATVLFAGSSIGFWSCIPLMFTSLNRILVSGLKARNEEEKKRIETFLTTFTKALPVAWVFAMIASISPIFILIDPANPNIMFGFANVHFVVLAIALCSCYFLVHRVMLPILEDIRAVLRHHSDERLKIVEWKLARFYAECRNQAIFQGLSAGIFGCWPFAQRYSSYEVPIAWLGAAPVLAASMYAMMPTRQKQVLVSSDGNNAIVNNNNTLVSLASVAATGTKSLPTPGAAREHIEEILIPVPPPSLHE